MGACSITSKTILAILTFIFWAAAAGLLYVGIYVYTTYKHYDQIAESNFTLIPASIILSVGVFMFLLGLIGCIAAFKENRCLLATFFSILLIIFTGMVVAGVLGWFYRHDVSSEVSKGIHGALHKYNNQTSMKNQVDYMQQQLKCCGSHNYTDWEGTPWSRANPGLKYPESCCRDKNCTNTMPDENLYTHGCYSYLERTFLQNLAVIAGVAAAFAVIMIIGMIFSCILLCRVKQEPKYVGLDSRGYRV